MYIDHILPIFLTHLKNNEEVFGPKSEEVAAVILACSHLSYQSTQRVRCEKQTQSTVTDGLRAHLSIPSSLPKAEIL